jgi:curli production assembly/transport component CsgG
MTEHTKPWRRRARTIAVAATASALIAGCTGYLPDAYESEYIATVGNLTAQNRALRDIPPPKHRIMVSVYDFPDLTGQYRERENVQSVSRAVTQGGAPILIGALQDAGNRRWFTVLDRSNLEALVRERTIVTEMRRQYRGETTVDPNALAPLAHAGIILQGGIIGYDSNTMTGGAGARYLGIGADRKWKLDVVTVSLRAVSTATGEVLANVVVRKPLASFSDRGSVFSYVALDELLEAEVGRASNEPRQIAVQQAIEKAVMALIAEGTEAGIWGFESDAAGQQYLAGYRSQLYDGEVPASAQNRGRPMTTNPAATVQTRPRAMPRVSERVLTPAAPGTPSAGAQSPAALPPLGAQPDETVG